MVWIPPEVGDIYQVLDRVCEYAGAHVSLLNRVEGWGQRRVDRIGGSSI